MGVSASGTRQPREAASHNSDGLPKKRAGVPRRVRSAQEAGRRAHAVKQTLVYSTLNPASSSADIGAAK